MKKASSSIWAKALKDAKRFVAVKESTKAGYSLLEIFHWQTLAVF
jgi:hypothetical protein